MLRAKNEQIMH